MTPYNSSLVPSHLHAMQDAARTDPHERSVLADWYEASGRESLAVSTRSLHGLYRPDPGAMADIMSS